MKYLPEDKIERVKDEPKMTTIEEGTSEDAFSILRSIGIEPKAGLKYCQDDEALYRSLLAEYAYGEIEKAHNLQNCYEKENWHDYSIYVHSLKSSSKMIGASAISMHAAKLEAAANASDSGTIKTEHDSLMEEYEVVTAVIRSVIPKEELDSEDSDNSDSTSDDEIMEFLPEDDNKN